MSKRAYGSGRLYVRTYSDGAEAWYGTWWVGVTRVKRKLGPKRRNATADGMTRSQAERELRRRMQTERVVAGPQRRIVSNSSGVTACSAEPHRPQRGESMVRVRPRLAHPQ